MRKAIRLTLALSAFVVAFSAGSRAEAATPQICDISCPPTIGSCTRTSCNPCCYKCPGSHFQICEL